MADETPADTGRPASWPIRNSAPKPRAPMGRRKTTLAARAMIMLANEGPMEVKAYQDAINAMSGAASNKAHLHTQKSLAEKGYTKTKVWLTPEGLARLKEFGWEPARDEQEQPQPQE